MADDSIEPTAQAGQNLASHDSRFSHLQTPLNPERGLCAIDRTLLAGLLLLSQSAALSAQTPTLTDPSKTMAASRTSGCKKSAQTERLPPTEGMSPTIIPHGVSNPGPVARADQCSLRRGVARRRAAISRCWNQAAGVKKPTMRRHAAQWFGSAAALVMTRSTQGRPVLVDFRHDQRRAVDE